MDIDYHFCTMYVLSRFTGKGNLEVWVPFPQVVL